MNKDYLHGGDVYHHAVRLDYSVNLNPLGTPASVIQAARDSIGQIQQYPDPEQAALTEALGKRAANSSAEYAVPPGATKTHCREV